VCVREKKMLRTGNEDAMSSPFFLDFFLNFSALQSHKFLVSSNDDERGSITQTRGKKTKRDEKVES